MGCNFIKDEDGSIKVNGNEATSRWRDYFSELLNVENTNLFQEEDAILGPLLQVQKEELECVLSLRSSKSFLTLKLKGYFINFKVVPL